MRYLSCGPERQHGICLASGWLSVCYLSCGPERQHGICLAGDWLSVCFVNVLYAVLVVVETTSDAFRKTICVVCDSSVKYDVC